MGRTWQKLKKLEQQYEEIVEIRGAGLLLGIKTKKNNKRNVSMILSYFKKVRAKIQKLEWLISFVICNYINIRQFTLIVFPFTFILE